MINKYAVISNDYHKSMILAQDIKNILKSKNFIEDITNPDYIFVIGGDGTLLKAVNKFQNIIDKVMIVIIKSGSLCFYSNYNSVTYCNVIKDILNNNYNTKYFPLLEIIYNNDSISYALNEIKIIENVKPIRTDIYVNNELLEHFRGSGLVFATNSGSTGYIKSVNGAIIASSAYKLWEMKEIAPIINKTFSTINAPLIFDNNQFVTLSGGLTNKKLIIDTFEYNITSETIKIKISYKVLKIIYDSDHEISITTRLRELFLHYSNSDICED